VLREDILLIKKEYKRLKLMEKARLPTEFKHISKWSKRK